LLGSLTGQVNPQSSQSSNQLPMGGFNLGNLMSMFGGGNVGMSVNIQAN
jgi:hypothetical protein